MSPIAAFVVPVQVDRRPPARVADYADLYGLGRGQVTRVRHAGRPRVLFGACAWLAHDGSRLIKDRQLIITGIRHE